MNGINEVCCFCLFHFLSGFIFRLVKKPKPLEIFGTITAMHGRQFEYPCRFAFAINAALFVVAVVVLIVCCAVLCVMRHNFPLVDVSHPRLLAHLALPKWRHRKFINSSCNAMQKTRRCDPHKTRFGANTIVYSVTALMHLWYAFGSARICGSSDWHLAHMSTWATVVRLFGRVPWWVRSCSKFRLFANEMCFLAKLLIFTEGCSCWRTFTLFLSLSLSHTIEPPILQWFYIGPKLWSHAFGLFWHLNNADGTYDRLLCMPNSSHSHIEASNALVCRYVPLAYSTLCHPLWL